MVVSGLAVSACILALVMRRSCVLLRLFLLAQRLIDKKTDVVEYLRVLHHVGLLYHLPSVRGGLQFV